MSTLVSLLWPILALVAGLGLLVKSADVFVIGAASVAKRLGIPSLLVGMVIIGFGTSAPELTVSAVSAVAGSPELALGNALGSNVANFLLILGVAACVHPLVLQHGVVRRELPLLAVTTIIAMLILALGGSSLSRGEAWVLLGIFFAQFAYSSWRSMDEAKKGEADGGEEVATVDSTVRAVVYTVGGLLILVASSKALVWGAVKIASALGASEAVIGLTIVAIGTSLPELASSVAAARRGDTGLAIGNVIGSNIFNTLAVIGLAGAIKPMEHFSSALVYRDAGLSALIPLLLCLWGLSHRGAQIGRRFGVLLLIGYAAYVAFVIF